MDNAVYTRSWRFLALLAVAFLLRIAAAEVWQARLQRDADPDTTSPVVGFGDSDGYLHLAERLADGKPYEYGWPHAAVFRTPGYPLLLAPLVRLTGNPRPIRAARWLGALLGTIVVGLASRIAYRLGGNALSHWTAWLVALNPATIFLSILILAEMPFSLFMLLAIEGLLKWHGLWKRVEPSNEQRTTEQTAMQTRLWGATLFAVASGLGTLIRPSWLLFIPAVVCGELLVACISRHWKEHLLPAICVALLFLLTLAPWMIRNHIRVGEPIPTTLQTGSSLHDGWHTGATGRSDMTFVTTERLKFLNQKRLELGLETSHLMSHPQAEGLLTELDQATDSYWPFVHDEVKQLSELDPDWRFEVEFDRHLRDLAVAWAVSEPLQVVRLALKKIEHLWSPWPQAENLGGRFPRLIMAAWYLASMMLAAIGMWKWRRRPKVLLVLLLPAIYFTGLHAIFVSSIRYREPAMLLITILAANGLVNLIPARANKSDESERVEPSPHL